MTFGEEHAAAAEDILKGLARHLNGLNEDNKATRKRALEAIKRETVDKGLSGGLLQELFSRLLKPLLRCVSDPAERCRETAILTLREFLRCVPRPGDSLVYLVPCLTQRLAGKEVTEPAEELRLSLMEMLSLTVDVCGKQLAPYLDDMISMLQAAIVDPFPDVRREGCKCTVNFANCVPGWLAGWLFVYLVGWLFGWLARCLFVWLAGCLVARLVGWLVGCLVGWWTSCLEKRVAIVPEMNFRICDRCVRLTARSFLTTSTNKAS